MFGLLTEIIFLLKIDSRISYANLMYFIKNKWTEQTLDFSLCKKLQIKYLTTFFLRYSCFYFCNIYLTYDYIVVYSIV